MIGDIAKIFIPTAISFFIGILITPIVTQYLYKYRMWKRVPRKIDGETPEEKMSSAFKEIHNVDEEIKTPRIGGIIIWGSIFLTTLIIFILSKTVPGVAIAKMDFLSRNQTLLPFFALMAGALIGLTDDLLGIYARWKKFAHGFPRIVMFSIVAMFGLLAGWWFFAKLGVSAVYVPFYGFLEFGWLFIPFFVLVALGTFSSGIIDGIDGLAGGIMATTFASYSAIAFIHNQIDIAAFCAAVVGGILVFLWFNIPPARFYMGETGMLGLVFCLAVIAFLTNSVFLLPIVGFPLFITSLSAVIQITSKKIWGPEGKIFKIAPLHHHFEAIGWSRAKITMRYWVISVVFAIIGIIISIIS